MKLGVYLQMSSATWLSEWEAREDAPYRLKTISEQESRNPSSLRNPGQVIKIHLLHLIFSKICPQRNLNTRYRVEGKKPIIDRAEETVIPKYNKSKTSRQIIKWEQGM